MEVVNILVWRGIAWAWSGFGGLDVGRRREVGGMQGWRIGNFFIRGTQTVYVTNEVQ